MHSIWLVLACTLYLIAELRVLRPPEAFFCKKENFVGCILQLYSDCIRSISDLEKGDAKSHECLDCVDNLEDQIVFMLIFAALVHLYTRIRRIQCRIHCK